MSKFDLAIGNKVFAPSFWDNEQITIKAISRPNVVGIKMVSFEEKGSVAIGENYVVKKLTEKKTISECMDHNKSRESNKTFINTSFLNRSCNVDVNNKVLMDGIKALNSEFFIPDYDMVNWLKEYAGDRVIIEVGSGTGYLLKYLKGLGAKVMGIEPNYDLLLATKHPKYDFENEITILAKPVENCGTFLKDLGAKALIVIARPCHTDFVENTINLVNDDTEVLYITKPSVLKEYDDLGKYSKLAKLIKHKGTSKDKEVVHSIIKQDLC